MRLTAPFVGPFVGPFIFVAGFLPQIAAADGQLAVDTIVRPGFAALADSAQLLADAAHADCTGQNAALRAAYNTAFDDWIRVNHLRFGPSETDNRAFALAFWPDTRGATPKALQDLITAQDPVIGRADAFSEVSIAARGFYAMEFLLYDPQFTDQGGDYICGLTTALADDIALTSANISTDWAEYTPSEPDEVLFNSLLTGLEFTAAARLGRPLGSFDRPRPTRAEARRSGRSLRHVLLSLQATKALAIAMADEHTPLVETLAQAFDRAIDTAENLDDPVFLGVDDPQNRLRVEILQQQVTASHQAVLAGIGPLLGVVQGFNALDGD